MRKKAPQDWEEGSLIKPKKGGQEVWGTDSAAPAHHRVAGRIN